MVGRNSQSGSNKDVTINMEDELVTDLVNEEEENPHEGKYME